MRSQSLSLFRSFLRTSSTYADYNFRSYALRNVRTKFEQNRSLTDSSEISNALVAGQQQLELLKRQTLISNLYPSQKSVME